VRLRRQHDGDKQYGSMIGLQPDSLTAAGREERKTVCPLLHREWLALQCVAESCADWLSRSLSQEDEPWIILQKFS
jgi:hypothetical protein